MGIFDFLKGQPIKEGLLKSYHENSQLKSEGNFKDNKKEGLWKWYYENSQLKYEGIFKDGKQEGLWKWYYENGQLEKEINYTD